MNYTTLKVPHDILYLAATNKGLCYVGNDERKLFGFAAKRHTSLVKNDDAMAAYRAQFAAYFDGKSQYVDVTLDVAGTELQQDVWKTLRRIPYGEVWTYSDVAAAIGRPSAVRAVANAIGRNPILIAIPCHRVIGKNGKLTGFSSGIPMKKMLLQIEGITAYKE